ncbi:hypothetical protein [Thiosocius teredinicola]|uniref:hypothetical protein n=1 Tax=Thiosocius teredinicola TaxID=1973002 RepID=UPI000990A6C4
MVQLLSNELATLRSSALDGLNDYLAECVENGLDPGYSKKDVKKCGKLIDIFIESLSKIEKGNTQKAKEAVRKVVVSLNELNKKCEGELILTDAREDLAALIIAAAEKVGYGNGKLDVTEKWRQW